MNRLVLGLALGTTAALAASAAEVPIIDPGYAKYQSFDDEIALGNAELAAASEVPIIDLGYAKYQGYYNETSNYTGYEGVRYAATTSGMWMIILNYSRFELIYCFPRRQSVESSSTSNFPRRSSTSHSSPTRMSKLYRSLSYRF